MDCNKYSWKELWSLQECSGTFKHIRTIEDWDGDKKR